MPSFYDINSKASRDRSHACIELKVPNTFKIGDFFRVLKNYYFNKEACENGKYIYLDKNYICLRKKLFLTIDIHIPIVKTGNMCYTTHKTITRKEGCYETRHGDHTR